MQGTWTMTSSRCNTVSAGGSLRPLLRCRALLYRALLYLALVCCPLLGGCCVTVPAADKYFDQSTPHNALRMFQYAIETKQYPAAYACLGAETQDSVSLAKFKLAVRFATLEQWDSLSLYDFIVNGVQHASLDHPQILGPGSHGVTVVFLPEDDDGTPVEQAVTMLREADGRWALDLLRIKGVHFP